MRAHMGGLPETHVMYHSTHSTDIITDQADVRRPCYRLNKAYAFFHFCTLSFARDTPILLRDTDLTFSFALQLAG